MITHKHREIRNVEAWQHAVIQQEKKLTDIKTAYKVKCECGKATYIRPTIDRILCDYCGHWIYRTEELKQKYKREDFERKFNKYLKDSKEKMKDVNRIEGRKLGVQQTTKNRKKTR